MVLEWGQDPQFLKWPGAPKYRTLKMSDILESPDAFLDEQTYARITTDLNINFDEAQFIKDTLLAQYSPRKIDIMPGAKEQEDQKFEGNVIFQSVDQIVVEGLKGIDSITVDKNLLIEIYRGLV